MRKIFGRPAFRRDRVASNLLQPLLDGGHIERRGNRTIEFLDDCYRCPGSDEESVPARRVKVG
jgi:hypothetical protein